MDLKIKKLLPALTATFMVCTSLCADNADGGQTMVMPVPDDMMMGANELNAPSARPYWQDVNGKMHVDTGAILDVELLVWQAHVDGLEIAVTNELLPGETVTDFTAPPFASRFQNAEYEHMSFKWDVGVRVGLGYYFEHDHWDVYGAWTHIHNKASKEIQETSLNTATVTSLSPAGTFSVGPATTGPEILFPTWSAALVTLDPTAHAQNGSAGGLSVLTDPTRNGNLTASGVEAHWKLKLDLIDAELGRLFFAGSWLTVRPHVGLRGGWIKQNFDIDYFNLTGFGVASTLSEGIEGGVDGSALDEQIQMTNEFKGVGVRLGVDTQWHFCDGVCLYGDVAATIMYGRYNISAFETDLPINLNLVSPPTTIILNTTDNFNDSKGITDLALGLCWQPDLSCYCNTMRLTLAAGWEHHMFFNQNQFKRVFTLNYDPPTDTSTIDPHPSWTDYVREAGDLSTQGVTITARFEF